MRRIIAITDGDKMAKAVVEMAANELGCRCISSSAGNPSPLKGEELVHLILQTPYDPVLVMFDDCGFNGKGKGEEALQYVVKHPEIETLGAIAVASNSCFREWTHVDVSIDQNGELTPYGVDKYGVPDLEIGRLIGDTVYSLDSLQIPIVVGIGDIGKITGADDPEKGAPITMKAVELILERSGYHRLEKREQ